MSQYSDNWNAGGVIQHKQIDNLSIAFEIIGNVHIKHIHTLIVFFQRKTLTFL